MASCEQLAHEVAMRLVACTSDAVYLRHLSKCVWIVLRECFVLCTASLFPARMKWKQSDKHVELVWAASCVCRSVLWLSGNRRCHWAKRAGVMPEQRHCEAVWQECPPKDWTSDDVRSQVDSLLCLQLPAIFPDDAHRFSGFRRDACVGLYTWVLTSGYYFGIGHAPCVPRLLPAQEWLPGG